MPSPLEILRLSPTNDIFQISDGIKHGLIEIDEDGPLPFDRLSALMKPEVQAVMHFWLTQSGSLIGSQHPPRLTWHDIELRLPHP